MLILDVTICSKRPPKLEPINYCNKIIFNTRIKDLVSDFNFNTNDQSLTDVRNILFVSNDSFFGHEL